MRIMLDLQGVQTPGSRDRGMGRYTMSLTKSMLRQGGDHEFHVVLNGAFMDPVDAIREELSEWVPQDRFHIFSAVSPTSQINAENDRRRIAAEICREAFISNLQPDLVHISSHFEGLFDNSISSIGRCSQSCPVAVTLYDLIPLIHRDIYLQNPDVERWYEDRLLHLRRADLLLAISESSANEAVEYLNFPRDRVVNVGTDADPQFESSEVDPAVSRETHARLGIKKPFVMYTGGIDWRKNIEGLLTAYSDLSISIRKKHQLIIVCSVQPEHKLKLEALARELGLASQEVLFTGYVAESDLITLYKSCKVFIFPSWHEGFGLPPLEAMRCGAPVIGGNRSSLPEVIGLRSALFNPRNERDMRERLEQALTDDKFRAELIEHGRKHNKNFCWQKVGRAALDAMETCVAVDARAPTLAASPRQRRKRLAFVSPIAPAPSGIADYSAELIPELSRHYDLEIIVKDEESAASVADPHIRASMPIRTIDYMKENFDRYDRVLYQFGNSDHHNHMFHALPDFPGVVVLHDFFLSGMISYEQYHHQQWDVWFDAVYRSHGYSAIAYQHSTSDLTAAVMRYPANRAVLANALGVIVHSEHSKDLALEWLGRQSAADWHLIPLLRDPVSFVDREGARARLGFAENDFIVSSFGFVNPTKQSRRILEAWIASPVSQQSHAKLVFVGANHPGEYGRDMLARIDEASCGDSVRIIGWTDQQLFREYLSASDVAVQLRMLSRGETSAAVLDALNYGLATVVNAHGSMAYLPTDAVLMLPDLFTDEQLGEAFIRLSESPELRLKMAEGGKGLIRGQHAPRECGDAYAAAIEESYEAGRVTGSLVVDRLRDLNPQEWPPEDVAQIATAAEVSTADTPATSFLDVGSELETGRSSYDRAEFADLIRRIFAVDLPRRIEPVYFDPKSAGWRYARKATLDAIGMPISTFSDDPVVFGPSSDLLRFIDSRKRQTTVANEPTNSERPRVVSLWELTPVRSSQRDSSAHPLAPFFSKLGFAVTARKSLEQADL